VPLDQGAGVLVEIVGAGRDEAVDAAGVGGGSARVGDQENRLVTFVFGLGQNRVTEIGDPLLEAHDRFLAVLDLKGCICHVIAPLLSIRVPSVRLSELERRRAVVLAGR